MMRIDILTLFPEFFDSPLRSSILGRAVASERLDVKLHNIRDWTVDKHHVTDDTPYGGGGGMVMKPDPVVACARAIKAAAGEAAGGAAVPVIYMSPQGRPLDAPLVRELAALPGMILLCGNYEGIDERAVELVVDREVSIGDYVLTGGEIAALVLINAVARHIPGVLGNGVSAENDSFEGGGLLDCPHYTRPEIFEGRGIPEVLNSGHHAKINQWRRERQLERTAKRRPDLLAKVELTRADRKFLARMAEEEAERESEREQEQEQEQD